MTGIIGGLAIVAPVGASPATDPATIQQNPLPNLELSVAANLTSDPQTAPESFTVNPELSQAVDLTATTPPLPVDSLPTTALAAIASDSGNAEATVANAENDIWKAPEMLPPADDRPASAPIVVPLTVPPPAAPPQKPARSTSQTPPPPTASSDDDLGSLPIRPIPLTDEDFGELPIRNLPPPPPPRPKWLYIGANVGYSGNSNSFFTRTKNADGLIQTGLNLTALLPVGPQTYLTSAIDSNIVRFGTFSELNYDELRLRTDIYQQLSPRMYGRIGWSNQKRYAANEGFSSVLSGTRLLNEHSFNVDLGRSDPITKRLAFNTFYQLRWSLSSQPDDDRLSNTFFTSLSYGLSPSWTVSTDYVVSWSHYTQIRRDPIFQRVGLQTRYAFSRDFSASLQGGFTFGSPSSDRQNFGPNNNNNDRAEYNGWSFGVTFAYSRGLF